MQDKLWQIIEDTAMTKTKTHYSYQTVEQMGEQNKIKPVQCEELVASCRRRCVKAREKALLAFKSCYHQ